MQFMQKTPFFYEFSYLKNTSSYYYTQEIRETKQWLKDGKLL